MQPRRVGDDVVGITRAEESLRDGGRMPRKIPLPRRLNGTSFLARDFEFHGLGRGRLRNRDGEHPFHGIYAVGVDLGTVFGLCRACESAMADDQFFSHSTAAELFGIPLPAWVQASPLHVATVAANAGARGAALDTHHCQRWTRWKR